MPIAGKQMTGSHVQSAGKQSAESHFDRNSDATNDLRPFLDDRDFELIDDAEFRDARHRLFEQHRRVARYGNPDDYAELDNLGDELSIIRQAARERFNASVAACLADISSAFDWPYPPR